MKWLGLGFLVVLVVAVLAHGVALWWAGRQVRGLVSELGTQAIRVRTDLPAPVAAYARRVGATGAVSQVRFSQSARMELTPGSGWQPYEARQWVDPNTAGFVWLAEQRKAGLPVIRVVDSFVQGRGLLVAWLLGSLPVARAQGPEMTRAEAMRYLAELPWVPDAILSNAALKWQVLAADKWQVSLGDAVVLFRLNTVGDIVEITAQDRPALEKGQLILRDWRGAFSEHGDIAGRRIPMRGEVGYVVDGLYAPYYRGRITGYEIDP